MAMSKRISRSQSTSEQEKNDSSLYLHWVNIKQDPGRSENTVALFTQTYRATPSATVRLKENRRDLMAELLCMSETSFISTGCVCASKSWLTNMDIKSTDWAHMFIQFIFFVHIQVWTQNSDYHITGSDKNHLCTCVGWCQREYRANIAVGFDNCRVKWLIYNAASPVAFAESIVASQDHERKEKPKQQIHNIGQHEAIMPLPL